MTRDVGDGQMTAIHLPNSDVNRLMQFDFSCLTRWLHPCRTQADIMLAAWQQFMEDQAHE